MKWLRLFLAVLLLGACLILIFRLAPGLMSREMTAGDDFVEYIYVYLQNHKYNK